MTDIYYLTYNHEDVPFYVGKSKNCYSRLFAHKKTYGKNIKMIKIDKVKNKEWLFWEKYYVSLFKSWGFKLDNKNNGGGGSTKASKEKIQKLKNIKSIPILQYDLQGNFIKEWKSGKQYAEENNLLNGTLITQCLKGKVPTAYNSLWRYKTDDYLKNINPPVYWKNNFKPITQHDINGNFIKEWDNMLIASKCLGLNKAGICNALKKRSKSSGGFIWHYKK
jgi:hypothetical protein